MATDGEGDPFAGLRAFYPGHDYEARGDDGRTNPFERAIWECADQLGLPHTPEGQSKAAAALAAYLAVRLSASTRSDERRA
jgi:hypothetical protein